MSQDSTTPSPGEKKKFNFNFQISQKGKIILTILMAVVAIGATVYSSIEYESHKKQGNNIVKPPPTYTGSAPLPVDSLQQARESNNDFILVITPCKDASLNTSVTATVVAAGDKIRSTDKIYVGVFTLPQNDSLAYPTVFSRLMNRSDNFIYQVTLREDITIDKIYDSYLSRKFFRE